MRTSRKTSGDTLLTRATAVLRFLRLDIVDEKCARCGKKAEHHGLCMECDWRWKRSQDE